MITKIKEQIIFKNKFFTVYNDEVNFNNKKKGTHLKLEGTNKQDGIAVLPVLENGNVLLIKNFRYAINDWVYQVVKGGNGTQFNNIDEALVCVKEELEEEIGLYSKNIHFEKNFFESPSILDVKGYAFIAYNVKEKKNRKRYQEDTEIIEDVFEIKIEDIDEFIKDKYICTISLYLLEKYKNHLLQKNKKSQ